MSGSGTARESWQVVQQPDGMWRWRWVSSEDGRPPMVSAHAFETPDEAEQSAREAYPELPGKVEDATAPAGAAKAKRRTMRALPPLILLALLVGRARKPSRSGEAHPRRA